MGYTPIHGDDAAEMLSNFDEVESKAFNSKNPLRRRYDYLVDLSIACLKLSELYILTEEQRQQVKKKQRGYGPRMSDIEKKLTEAARREDNDPSIVLRFDMIYFSHLTRDQEACQANAQAINRHYRTQGQNHFL